MRKEKYYINIMSFFKESTQAKNWIKTQSEIEDASKHKAKMIIKRIKEINDKIQKEIKAKAEPSDNNNVKNEIEKELIKYNKLITPDKENLLIIYFTNQILKIINSNIKSLSLKTYALTYFRRFYLKKAVVDYDPEFMLCAAIFLGGKVAQYNINFYKMGELIPFLNEQSSNPNKSNLSTLLEYEFYLCVILNYELYVFCPYKAMLGFVYELDKKKFFSSCQIKEDFQKKCQEVIDKTFLCDLLFLYNYSYLALASIFIVGSEFAFENDKLVEALELSSMIDVNKFINETLVDIKTKLSSIKIIEQNEFVEHTKRVILFNKRYPRYNAKLEEERRNLLKKMADFYNYFNGEVQALENIEKQLNAQKMYQMQQQNDPKMLQNKRDREEDNKMIIDN